MDMPDSTSRPDNDWDVEASLAGLAILPASSSRPISMPGTPYDPYATTPLTMQPPAHAGHHSHSTASYLSTDPHQRVPTSSLPTQHRASSGAWNAGDDQTLLGARASGQNWAQIQQNYFPSKTPNSCRKRHERLMERRGADDWDTRRLERMAKEYMGLRKEIWSPLASRTGEKWNVVEQRSMSSGLKNIQGAAQAAVRRERLEASLPPNHPFNDDSGISGLDSTEDDELQTMVAALRESLLYRAQSKLQSKSEIAPGSSIVSTSAAGETSPNPWSNSSVFDDVLSSVSSLSNEAQAVFVGAFVDLLIRDASVDRLIARATSDAGIGAERFRGEFSRILKTYSGDLRDVMTKQQQEDQRQKRVATFISRKRTRVSNLLVVRYRESAPNSDSSTMDPVGQYLSGLVSDDSDTSDDEGLDTELTTAGLESFLLQGRPFRTLKWQLRSLLIPDQRVTQVQESAERLLNFMFYNLWLEESFARAYECVPDFDLWLRLRIDALAESLETELRRGHPVTEYLCIYSAYLSAQAVRRLRQRSDVSYTHSPEPSSCAQQKKVNSTEMTSAEEILEDTMAEKMPGVFGGDFSQKTVWTRLLSTKAFRDFFSDLSDVAYPTFFSECRKALNAQVDSQDPQSSAQSEERYLLSILAELQWCSARHGRGLSFRIEPTDSLSRVDQLKLAIEHSTGSEWSWWPLSPPPRAGSKAYVELESLGLRQRFTVTALLRTAAWVLFPLHVGWTVLAVLCSAFAGMALYTFPFDHVPDPDHDGQYMIVPRVEYMMFFHALVIVILSLHVHRIMNPRWPMQSVTSPDSSDSQEDHADHLNILRIMNHRRSLLSVISPDSSDSQEDHADHAKVISWTCRCGSTRRELVSPKNANLLQQLANEYPTAHHDNKPIQLDTLSALPTPTQSQHRDSSPSADTQSVGSLNSTDGDSSRASISTAPSSADSTSITMDFNTQAFVHLLVRKGGQYVLSSMKVTDKDARRFFQDLVVRYGQHRGFLRRIFSIFVYSHCDFVKVKHHRAHRFSPVPSFSFPERGRDIEYHEYTYSPQPMTQAPITRHMFNDLFYSCYDRDNLTHHFLHKFLSSCDVIETLPQDLLDNMPKRDREVVTGAQFSRVEHFWGIVAREQRSALRVVVYMLLSLMPTIWFLFMWLFVWGHEGDLQNATVPVTISIATLSMVWIVVYSGGEIGDE